MPEADHPKTMDCLVISGGGAKGAYAAGVAKALFQHRKLKSFEQMVCYVGTSVGALNACLLAVKGPDALFRLWSEMAPSKVLGWAPTSFWPRLGWALVSPGNWYSAVKRRFGKGETAFSLYGNDTLKETIQAELNGMDFDAFQRESHLIIAVTNYTLGTSEAFYVSAWLDKFKEADARKPLSDRRLQHFRRIENQEMLVQALLASAAIPLAFPPVKIGPYHYVDGGICNNSPTREAALFLRQVNEPPIPLGVSPGKVYCVFHDPPGTILKGHQSLGLPEIGSRTYELFFFTQLEMVLRSWHQINENVRRHDDRVATFKEAINKTELSDEQRQQVLSAFEPLFGKLRGSNTRLNLDLIEIQPSDNLGSTLDFSNERAGNYLSHGYRECLKVLLNRGIITPLEETELLNRIQEPVQG